MIRMVELTEKDLEMVKKLSGTIEELDGLVFPENPIEAVILQQAPGDESKRFRYCSQALPFITEGESYLIFGAGLHDWSEKKKKQNIMLFENSELSKNIDQLPNFSLEEVLIGLSVHEIRHRFQYHHQEKIFSPRDAEKINNPYFKRLFKYVALLCEQISPNSFEKEFDASLVEHWAIERWHRGERCFNEIAKIIKLEL